MSRGYARAGWRAIARLPALRLMTAALLAAAAPAGGAAEEFTFDASQFARKTFELSGYVELRGDRLSLNPEGSLYKLGFYNRPAPARIERATLTVKPNGQLLLGESSSFKFRGHLEYQDDNLGSSHQSRFDEGYLSYKPMASFALDAGKVALRWGKGYAWNPVAFVERPKDPNEPDLAREGFAMVRADIIRNFDGPLQTLAFTPVIVPVTSRVNGDFGQTGHVNVAGKLYLLYRDTDIDFMFLSGGSRARRVGVDFSRNIGSNLEIHGEWAKVYDVRRPVIGPTGAVSVEAADGRSYLLGLRHLTESRITTILEYYRNGSGYDESQLGNFHQLVDRGSLQFDTIGNPALLQRASNALRSGYGQPNPGRRYLYLRVSQAEPFDILYFVPSITTIVNLDDQSFSIAPEVSYSRFRNLDLRVRWIRLQGDPGTDFGEKQNRSRLELRVRYAF